MLRSLLAVAVGVASAGTAFAADFLTYPSSPPPIGDPIYAPVVQAHVDLYGGVAFLNYDADESETAGVFGGAGRANAPFGNNWNLQLDAQGSALVFSDGGSYSYPEFGGYAHLYSRDPNSHALGVFGGADFPQGASLYTFGVEGQMYWPQFTLYTQASLSAVNAGSSNGHAAQVRGQGQWFPTDDTIVTGDLIWTGLNLESYQVNVLSVGGGVLHRFSGSPWAGFVRGRWDHATGEGSTTDAFTALAGVRLHADPAGSTEKSHRRTGPAMDVEPVILGGPAVSLVP